MATIDIPKYAFVAGEISPQLFGRGDVKGYDFGLAKIKNTIVDYRGGVFSRPGTLFCEPLPPSAREVRLFNFRFNSNPEDNYLLVFTAYDFGTIMYVLQNGKWITERALPPTTVSDGDRGIIYCTGVDVRGVCRSFAYNGERVESIYDGVEMDSGEQIPPTADNRVVGLSLLGYSINRRNIHDIQIDQFRDELILTHESFAPIQIERRGVSEWTVKTQEFASFETFVRNNQQGTLPFVQVISNPTYTERLHDGNVNAHVHFVLFEITMIDKEGRETPVMTFTTAFGYSFNAVEFIIGQLANAGFGSQFGYRIYATRAFRSATSKSIPHTVEVPSIEYDLEGG